MILTFLLFEILFFLAQGFAVFATAFLAAQVTKRTRPFEKIAAMVCSFVIWSGGTIMGYTLLGGEGGFFDGFGLVLMLCATAFLSSTFFCLVWVLSPAFASKQHG